MCVVVPPGPGLKRPPTFNKFPPGATLWISLNIDGTAKDIKVIPKKPDYGDTLRPLDSYGASKEEIFYFESYVQTYKLWGLAGLADSMEKGVEQFENRPEWKKKMAALNKSIERVSKQADDLYEEIGNTLVRSPNLSPPSEDAAKASEGVENAGDGAQ